VYKINLQSAKELAVSENLQIDNARKDIAISKKKVWETTAIGLPQASASLSYNNYIDLPTTLVPAAMFNPQAEEGEMIALQFGTTHNASFQFSANQLIFSGEYIVGLQAAKTYKFLSQQNLDKTIEDVLENVYQTYYTLLFAIENQKILENSVKDMQKSYDETKEIYQAGLVDKTSLDQLELNLRSLNNSLSSINRQIETQEKLLKFQLGLDINDSIEVEGNLENAFKQTNLESILLKSLDVGSNVNYKIVETQEALQSLNVKREKSAYLPTLSAFYQHQQSGQGDDFNFYQSSDNWFPANIIGASLNIPIFSSGSRNAKVSQAQIELSKIENSKLQLEQSLKLEMEMAKSDLTNSFETYLKEKENLVLSKSIYEKGLEKFKAGTISSIELTQLNIQYLTSQTSYYSSILNVMNNKIKIDKLLGKL
jgi:outer membrane protein TolC